MKPKFVVKRFFEMTQMKLQCIDGELGTVADLLIEDDGWQVRYLVASLDGPLRNQQVLVSPTAIVSLDFELRQIGIELSSQQLFESPPLDLKQPISRQYEQALVDHYSWPIYWLGRIISSPQAMASNVDSSIRENIRQTSSNLRSAKEICGYVVDSNERKTGYLIDLMIDVDSWVVEYATSDSGFWRSAQRSTFSTSRIEKVDWSTRRISVDLPACNSPWETVREPANT